ncbi:hypothetical protein HYPSUDRAFT_1041733 [Hypholoma sublateritium FD-334 SS-4]|uniref:Uncharacterized protein n=1 Tax=Hypholoma sublateritium (strain FD-334 SS-4) TaxID=945553 RepID=A0A0D2KRH9_HYPSF|nr:hypothetical protein HYPSUDRAFT_1041733 [Hypholoma sublateritium FD-334 SS-4]
MKCQLSIFTRKYIPIHQRDSTWTRRIGSHVYARCKRLGGTELLLFLLYGHFTGRLPVYLLSFYQLT